MGGQERDTRQYALNKEAFKDILFTPKQLADYLCSSVSALSQYRALDVVDTILEENEPANYTDKHEIVRILKAAVDNGANENMAEQHADAVQDMLGQDRVFD